MLRTFRHRGLKRFFERGDKSKLQAQTRSPKSVLLVQCCHLPQFFYLAEKLRERNPEWNLSALVSDRPQVRFYLELFPPFDHLFFFDKSLPEMPGAFDQVLCPLLNRGYLRIKRAARRLSGAAYEIDYQGERRALTLGPLIRSFAAPLHRPPEEFAQYLGDFPHRPLGEKILVVETCHRSLADSSKEKWGRLIPDQAEVTRISASTEGQGWRALRRQNFDSGVVFFSGEKGFANLKLLPFLLGLPEILVVNEHGDYFYATSRSLLRLLWRRVWQGVPLPKPSPRILVIQTESPTYVRRAIKVLRKPEMFPRSRICLLCRKKDADSFRNVSGLERILTYSRQKVWRSLGLRRDLKGFDADMVAAVFSGRRVFRKQKLLYFLLPIRHHLAFNARSDCYRLTPRTLFWTFRKDPSFFAAEKQPVSPILFLLTAEDSKAVEAIEKLQNPKVVSPQPIVVFCREDKRSFYQALPGVEEVRTYALGRTWENLKTVLALARSRVEVVSSIFSPQPAFRLQKLLFVLLPARHRLAFNQEDLNCYYLKGSHDRSGQPSVWGTLLRVLLTRSRRGVRPTLFFPTAEDSKAAEVIQKLQNPKVVSPQPIVVFCREDKRSFYQALPGVEEVRTYAPGRTWENLKTVLALARSRVEVVSSIFSPQPAFRLQKLLFVLLPARHRLAFNQEDLNCYYLKGSHDRSGQPSVWGTLLRVLLTRSRRGVRPTLFFPTAEDSKAAEVIQKLQNPKVVSPQPIVVFCREDKRSFYQALPGVEEVRTYAPGRTWENLKTVLALARSRVEVVSSIFSPQPAFRLQKLLFVLLPARHRLAFNQEDLNCYYLKGSHDRSGQPSVWGTLLRVLLTRSRRGVRPTLFFPTAEDSKAVEVIQRLQDPKIAAKSIVVFCREDKRLLYEDLPTVEAVWTYAPGSSLRHLMTWVRLLRTRVDLVCAIFSGRPTFRLQKFLFLTLRARNRLVFNEDLNCYMLRGHLARFLQPQGRNWGLDRSVLILVVRKVLKWFLFVPRFLYLILWAAVVTMRARRRISQERSRANFSPDC